MVVEKLWGHEKTLVNNELYCGKIIHVYEGKMGSFHYHKNKDETFYILNGKIKLKYSMDDNFDEAKEIVLYIGDSFRIIPNMRHQIIGIQESDIIEISTFDEESDSIRVISSENFI